MPNRILREGILTSERVNLLEPAVEVFYRRLMSVVDDFGRYYAKPSLLRAACYPLQLDRTADADISNHLNIIRYANLATLYSKDGKSYLEIVDFRQQIRAQASKFPEPTASDRQTHSKCVSGDKQLIADAHLDVDVDEGVVGTTATAVVVKPAVSPCPHLEIISLYHKHLPTGRQVVVEKWNGARAKHLQARWREDPKQQSLQWWDRFLGYCAKSDFLTGKSQPRPGRDPFLVSLDWIVEPGNFVKIIEGAYNREKAT